MGGCRCSYKNCERATNNSEQNFHFFHYPSKDYERSLKWIANARKPSFLDLPKDQLRNKVVCQNHFEPHYFTNQSKKRLIQAAVPTLDVGCSEKPEQLNVKVLHADERGTVFTVDTESINPPNVHNVTTEIRSFLIANGDVIPANTTLEQNETTIHEEPELQLYSNSCDPLKLENKIEVLQETFVKTELENNNDQFDVREGSSVQFPNTIRGPPASPPPTALVKEAILAPVTPPPPFPPVLRKFTDSPSSPPKFKPVLITSTAMPNSPQQKLSTSSEKKPSIVSILPQYPPPSYPSSVPNTSSSLPNTPPLKKKCPTPLAEKRQREVSPNMYTLSKTVEKHTEEITKLKKILHMKIRKTKRTKIDLLNKLRSLIPSTLCAAVSLHLFKKEKNFTRAQKQFLTALHETSPTVIDMLNDRLKWKLPRSDIVRNMILNGDKLK